MSIPPGRPAIRRLALAALISGAGSWAGGLALPFALYQITGSGRWVAASWLLTFGIIGFFSPVAGAIADRFDRRHVMITCDLLSLVCWVAIAAIHVPAAMLALGFAAELVDLPFNAASSAAVPNLVETEDLEWANSTIGVAFGFSSLVGPAVGGVMIATLGANATFAVNAFSFGVSALLVWTIRGRFSAPGTRERVAAEAGSIVHRTFAGLRLVWDEPVLRALAIVWTMQYFAVDAALVADPPLVRLFAAGAIGYGILNSGWGLGSIIGSFLGRRTKPELAGLAVAGGSIATAIGYTTIFVAPWFGLIVAMMTFVALADGINNVAGYGLIQRRAPDQVRGRTFSSIRMLGLFANAIAFTLAGVLIDPLGPRAVYLLGAGMAVLSFPFLPPLLRSVRGHEVRSST